LARDAVPDKTDDGYEDGIDDHAANAELVEERLRDLADEQD
jgi:hypothetical protein